MYVSIRQVTPSLWTSCGLIELGDKISTWDNTERVERFMIKKNDTSKTSPEKVKNFLTRDDERGAGKSLSLLKWEIQHLTL